MTGEIPFEEWIKQFMAVEEFNLLVDIKRKGGKIFSCEIPSELMPLIEDLLSKGYLAEKKVDRLIVVSFGRKKARVILIQYVLTPKAKKLLKITPS